MTVGKGRWKDVEKNTSCCHSVYYRPHVVCSGIVLSAVTSLT